MLQDFILAAVIRYLTKLLHMLLYENIDHEQINLNELKRKDLRLIWFVCYNFSKIVCEKTQISNLPFSYIQLILTILITQFNFNLS